MRPFTGSSGTEYVFSSWDGENYTGKVSSHGFLPWINPMDKGISRFGVLKAFSIPGQMRERDSKLMCVPAAYMAALFFPWMIAMDKGLVILAVFRFNDFLGAIYPVISLFHGKSKHR